MNPDEGGWREHALHVGFEFWNAVHLDVGHSVIRTRPRRGLVKLTLLGG